MIWPQLILWVVSFVLQDYFRERLPSQTASGLGDFTIPTATEGRVVPLIIGGSMRIESPNCVWYGDFAAVERTTTTGIIFKRDETIGYRYELSLQYVQCKTPTAGITGIWIGDDQVFDYVADAAGVPQVVVDVDRDDLFGGTDNGGGFQGRIRLHTGAENQAVDAFLDTHADLDPLPAYRGTSYIVVSNIEQTMWVDGWRIVTIAAETKGATIGESNQLRYIRVSLQAFDTVANGGLGDSMTLGNDEHFIGEDANPISVAYDLYTNPRWGRSFPPSDIDLPSFQAANATCYTEGIGFSQVIDEETTTGAIQDTIEQHVDGYIGPNPVTGRIEVTLARQDYVPANEFQATAVNIESIKKWSKGDWSQTWNRVRVRYSDRAKQWNETHAVELAPGNRIIQGGRTKTKEMRFQGVHTASVASKIAARARRGQSQPIASGTIELNRTAYELRPGSIIVVTSDKIGETNLPTRVTKAGVGNVEKNTMEFEVVTDVFDAEIANVVVPPPSDFVPPVQAVIPFTVDDQAAFEPPFILQRYNATPNLTRRIATLARRNTGNVPTQYEVIRRTRNPPTAHAGAYTSTDVVQAGFCVVGTLRNAELGWQAGNGTLSIQVDPISPESLDGLIGQFSPTAGNGGTGNANGLAVISPGLADEEFIICQDIVDDGAGIALTNTWRAAMDTSMKPHALGAQVWFIFTGGLGMGDEQYNLGDGVEMKFLPISPNDALTEPEATALPEVLMDESTDDRTWKPLVPIDLLLNGVSLPGLTDEVDMNTIHTTPSAFIGAAAIPQLRDSLNSSPLGSVMALDQNQTGFDPTDVTDRVLELQWWIHDLDTNPTAPRTSALAGSGAYDAQSTANQQFDIDVDDLIAGGAVGFEFNARLEVEMRHSPVAQTALNISHDTMDLDFIATGIFSVLPDAPLHHFHFDGADLDTETDDASAPNQFVQFNGAAELDTGQSVFGGSSVLLDGIDSYLRIPSHRDFDVNLAWTVECRIRFTNLPTLDQAIVGQFDGSSLNSWQIYYDEGQDQFRVTYSTSGSSVADTDIHTGTWVPIAGTWYALAVCKTAAGVWHVFIDGTRVGTAVTFSPNWFESSQDLVIGSRFNSTDRYFDGNIDEMRITNRCLYLADYTIETIMFPDARGAQGLLAHMEGTNLDTTVQTDDLMDYTINATATSEISTGQSKFGSTSLRCDGVQDKTTIETSDASYIEETVSTHPQYQPRGNPFDFRRGDFTIECHFYLNALPSTNPSENQGFALLSKSARPLSGGYDWRWQLLASNTVSSFARSPNGAVSSVQASSATIPTLATGQWYHAAVVRIGDDLHQYFEGNRVAQEIDFFGGANVPDMWNDDSPSGGPNPVGIGRTYSVNGAATRLAVFNGYIDEVNVEKRALYNGSTYTIPTAPSRDDPRRVIADSNERDTLMILDHFDGSDFFATDHTTREESAIGSRRIFDGNAHLNDTYPHGFGPTALNLDGNGDAVRYHTTKVGHRMGDSDFTIDCWARHDTLPHLDLNGGHCLVSQWNATVSSWAFYLDEGVVDTETDLVFEWSLNGTDRFKAFVNNVNASIAINTWTHYQVVRDGSTLYLFIDGVLQTLDGSSNSIGTDIINHNNQQIYVGYMPNNGGLERDFDGQIDELRITRTVENTVTFTPMTGAYPDPVIGPWY